MYIKHSHVIILFVFCHQFRLNEIYQKFFLSKHELEQFLKIKIQILSGMRESEIYKTKFLM